MQNTNELISQLSNNFTDIIYTDIIKTKYPELYWGGNGLGDRWCKKKYNYAAIYKNKPPKIYSENTNDFVPNDIIKKVAENTYINNISIIGIFVFSKRNNIQTRNININITKKIKQNSCVICGSYNDIICDHKNDLYNDNRVLDVKTQLETDFQPLCNHCNLQKREICKKEKQNNRIYFAKNIQRYTNIDFEFAWEKKNFNINDINCKIDTYWYDPVEFDYKIYKYGLYLFPIIKEIKHKIKLHKITLIH
jgi:hypothetical protein